MATISDVARLAGVSTSTVSHVINGTRPVRDETRVRVEEAVRSTGYRRDSLARALRRSRTDSIGLILTDVAEPAFAAMARGVEREAMDAGLTVLLANSGEDAELEARALEVLAERRVDGLLIAPVARSHREAITAVIDQGTPVVLIDRLGEVKADQVGVENTAPMRELVLHMVSHGHRRIALAVGDTNVSTIAERRRGYLEALDEAGLDVDETLIVTGSGRADDTRERMTGVLRRHRPSAVVAASTETAVGVLTAAKGLSLTVPEDFAFATFDGFPHTDLFRPGITAVAQPAHEVGATAMQLLISRIDGSLTSRPRTVRLEPEITYRESCGCPA
ncbi:LacI family transcription regulator [Streptomyces davaonensis JCM 4913]|uniref:LacI family transcription regulator n=1 Tax=Streptomyces davaonensis (strain DSM 101723 / JCM 4913 / KCC S-0913 / 768) TaxID=1214101 RepID=K4QSF7_STRDJ|nr:LacI family DNA-binding transcriptional regulator [Streptomyces davaonensis]CCK24571.1 LacI family transcription regulator [Streptomyces davaonensis JCM 4913]